MAMARTGSCMPMMATSRIHVSTLSRSPNSLQKRNSYPREFNELARLPYRYQSLQASNSEMHCT